MNTVFLYSIRASGKFFLHALPESCPPAFRSIIYSSYDVFIDRKPVETVTISPKYQVVIPKDIRNRLKLIPGQKVQAILYEDRIELIPVRPIKKMRGFLKGIDTEVPREEDRF